jgi:hypothetical protein
MNSSVRLVADNPSLVRTPRPWEQAELDTVRHRREQRVYRWSRRFGWRLHKLRDQRYFGAWQLFMPDGRDPFGLLSLNGVEAILEGVRRHV